jgi:hypothetical protein
MHRFTPTEAQDIEDGCRGVFEAADRAGHRAKLDAALADAEREAGGTPVDVMVTVLRWWCLGHCGTRPDRSSDLAGLKAVRQVLGAYRNMEERRYPTGPRGPKI